MSTHGGKQEIPDSTIIGWLWEAELEERRVHVLFEDVYEGYDGGDYDPESVIDHERLKYFINQKG